MNKPIFHLRQELFSAGWVLRFGILHDDDSVTEALPVVMEHRKREEIINQMPSSPMIAFGPFNEGKEALQSLMDELWRNGIRPSDIGTPGHLEATKSHLKDMRAIVSKTLGVEL